MKHPPAKLQVYAARILAVTPRAPRTALDSVVAEIGILIGDLCESSEQAEKLAQHLVEQPQPRWNFPALKVQAQRFIAALTAPPPPNPAAVQLYGFEAPEWVWKASQDGRANCLQEFCNAIDAELWRRVEFWPPELRQQREAEIRAMMADYHRQHGGPFEDPSAAQIKHYLIVTAGKENEAARLKAGALEPCPFPEPPNVRPKTTRA